MRIAIGQIAHETNTFCPGTTPIEAFYANELSRGQVVIETNRGVRTYVGGMIDAAERLGVELVPTISTWAMPSATIARACYDQLTGWLLDDLRAAMPLDAVCLALHGAGVAEGIDDIEGAQLKAVRELVGPRVPITVALDLHGNVTPAMVEHADALLGVEEYPHVDSFERGAEALELAARIARGEVRPAMYLARLPMALPTSTTRLSPARDINARCAEWEAKPGIIDCTFFHGFAHTDIPEVAVTVVAIADGDAALARQAAEAVAAEIWRRREEFRPTLRPVEATLREAMAHPRRPVVVNETSDNPGGGSPGDATHLLRAMLELQVPDACYGYIFDPETAEQAHRAGVGATIRVRLGGKTDDLHGAPIEADAYVKCLTDGKFIAQSPMGRGARIDRGRSARLIIGGIDVLVASVRSQVLDPEIFLLHGIDVTRYQVVALKSSQHFRAGFDPVAALTLRADTPGATSVDLTSFPYRRLRRPIWPLDENVTRDT